MVFVSEEGDIGLLVVFLSDEEQNRFLTVGILGWK